MQICVSDKLQIPPNDPLDTFGSESAFASKGLVLKYHFLNAFHFPEINGSRFETSWEFGRKKSFEHENGVLDLPVLPFHCRKTKIMWFCWIFGILHSDWPDKDRGAMLAARETVNLLFSHVWE